MRKEKIIYFLLLLGLLQLSFMLNDFTEVELATGNSITPELKWQSENILPSSPPIVADLNYDGRFEVIIGTEDGLVAFNSDGSIFWKKTIGYKISSVITTDLQKDREVEILAISFGLLIMCFNQYGEQLWNYSNANIWGAIAVDINNDHSIEVITCTPQLNGTVLCLNNTGALLWEFHASYPGTPLAVADLNADGNLEILVKNRKNKPGWFFELLCLQANGSLNWSSDHYGYPYTADINRDSSIEIILTGSEEGIVCLNASGGYQWNISKYTLDLCFADLEDSESLEIIAFQENGNLTCLNYQRQVLWEYSIENYTLGAQLYIADMDGDTTLDIIMAFHLNGSLICMTSTGEVLWQLSLPSSNIGECIIDLDRNKYLELLISNSNALYCYEMSVSSFGKAPWYCYGGTVFHTRTLDSDYDYVDDLTEQFWWETNPQIYDTDEDFLSDGEEILLYHTNPQNGDTDSDGFLDGDEIRAGTNPLDAGDNPRKQILLLVAEALAIVIPSYFILSFILIITIRKVITQPWYIIKKTIGTVRNEKQAFFPLERLAKASSYSMEKITRVLEKKAFCKKNNVLFIQDRIYFLDKVDLQQLLKEQKKVLVKIQKMDEINQTFFDLIYQTKSELQIISTLANKLNDQPRAHACQDLLNELNLLGSTFDFNTLIDRKK